MSNIKVEEMIYLKDGRIYMMPHLKEYDITDHVQTLIKELEKIKGR
ncbi:hypothetical protein [Streptococcus uberis]|nr:hypothetical protein [Streptococcus uberis]MBY4764643.1 hypothetical protein [Streptococcus uberis]